jgi:hypothetical protein
MRKLAITLFGAAAVAAGLLVVRAQREIPLEQDYRLSSVPDHPAETVPDLQRLRELGI